MDGSRLLEVLPFYGRSLDEISSLFDSVAISFTEGLGALSGAMRG
jgi:threonine aldolase